MKPIRIDSTDENTSEICSMHYSYQEKEKLQVFHFFDIRFSTCVFGLIFSVIPYRKMAVSLKILNIEKIQRYLQIPRLKIHLVK